MTTATLQRYCTATPAPPSSPETEMAVIGCCMMHPSAFREAAAIIGNRPVFHETQLAKLWHIISGWYSAHLDTRPDGTYLWNQLEDTVLPSDCLNVGCLPANIGYHTGELLRLWRLRRSRDLAGLLAMYIDKRDTEGAEACRAELLALDADADNSSLLNPQSVMDAGEPPPVVFRGGMVEGALGIIAAVDGIGKSMLALDIALNVATLHPVVPSLRRYRDVPGNVMVLSYEDCAENIKQRLNASAERAGIVSEMKQAFDDNRLRFYFPETPVFSQTTDGMIVPTPLYHEIDREAARIKPDLIILDPYSAVSTSPENDNNAGAQIGQHLNALAGKYGCGVLVLHHVAKGRVDDEGHLAMRGNTGLPSKARWIARLLTIDGNHDRLRLHFAKDSYNKRIDDVFFDRTVTGTLKELTREVLSTEVDALRDKVVTFIAANPDMKISKNAVRLNNSKAAKAMVDSLNASPAQIYDAIVSALKGHYLTEEVRNNGKGYEQRVLVRQSFDDYEDDDQEVPF